MQTEVAKAIAEKVNALTPEQQAKVLDYVSSIEAAKKSIWDKLDERLSKVPQEELDQLPADASANLNHYLYGTSKK